MIIHLCTGYDAYFLYIVDSKQLGVPIATKKLAMKEEFLMSAEDLYQTLTDEKVCFVIKHLVYYNSIIFFIDHYLDLQFELENIQ